MFRVYFVFNDDAKRVRWAKTKTAAQLIAMKETTKRKIKFFSIDRVSDRMILS